MPALVRWGYGRSGPITVGVAHTGVRCRPLATLIECSAGSKPVCAGSCRHCVQEGPGGGGGGGGPRPPLEAWVWVGVGVGPGALVPRIVGPEAVGPGAVGPDVPRAETVGLDGGTTTPGCEELAAARLPEGESEGAGVPPEPRRVPPESGRARTTAAVTATATTPATALLTTGLATTVPQPLDRAACTRLRSSNTGAPSRARSCSSGRRAPAEPTDPTDPTDATGDAAGDDRPSALSTTSAATLSLDRAASRALSILGNRLDGIRGGGANPRNRRSVSRIFARASWQCRQPLRWRSVSSSSGPSSRPFRYAGRRGIWISRHSGG